MSFIVSGAVFGAGTAVTAAGGAAIGASVLGTVISGYGMYQQGQSAKATASYNAKLAENEAKAKAAQEAAESKE